MNKLVFIILLFYTIPIFSADLPLNAVPSQFGKGWDCQRGYFKSGNQCNQVVIPENAQLNYLGNGWDCIRGFAKVGQRCSQVVMPANAQLNYLGNGWDCQRGYFKSGNQCNQVVMPSNAHLNYLGNDWECNKAYKKIKNECAAMSSEEIQKQSEIELSALKKYREHKARILTEGDCETEDKTNARVCVNVTSSDIDCQKNYDHTEYRDCDVSINYDVETDYAGGTYLDVDVICKVEIEYKGRNSYGTKSEDASSDESYNLYANGSDSETKEFNFSFSSFEEVTSAKISKVECEIDNVELQ